MNVEQILIHIDSEIARLQQAKAILTGGSSSTPKKRGRPAAAKGITLTPKRRSLSPEARAKIAAAQKKRWAAQKKAAK
jgi:hypothetical protein